MVTVLPHSGNESGNVLSEVVNVDIGIELHVVVVAEFAEDLSDGFLLFGHDEVFATAIAVVGASGAETFAEKAAHGGIVVAAHVGKDVAEAACCPHDANLLEIGTLAVGKGVGIDGSASGELGGNVLACEMSQALLAQRATVVEAECIAAGHAIEIECFVCHDSDLFLVNNFMVNSLS